MTGVRVLLATALAAVSVVACGGGDDAAAAQPVLTSFEVEPGTLVAPATGNRSLAVRWDYRADGATGGVFALQLHVLPEGSDAPPGDTQRVLHRNCTAAFPCSDPHSTTCLYDSGRRLGCEGAATRVLAPGRYVVVGSVCVFDASLQEVCARLSRQLEVR